MLQLTLTNSRDNHWVVMNKGSSRSNNNSQYGLAWLLRNYQMNRWGLRKELIKLELVSIGKEILYLNGETNVLERAFFQKGVTLPPILIKLASPTNIQSF